MSAARKPVPRGLVAAPHFAADAPAASADVAIGVRAAGWRRAVPRAASLCRRAVAAALQESGAARPGESAVVLADDRLVRRLNRDWRGKDAPTNVLAFPSDPPDDPSAADPPLLGDVVIALGTVRREARSDDKPVADHLAHLVIHGTLHLLGHDHQRARQAARMEALEVAALARLGIANPYRDAHTRNGRRR
jgi:probable rRNA maturation factor